MVEQLLDLARLESGQFQFKQQPVDLADLLTAVRDTLLPQAQAKSIELALDLTPIAPIAADRDLLTQLLTNLADNALTHTPAAGTVQLGLAKQGEHAQIIVSDTGRGIAPQDLDRLFERFYRADKSRQYTDQQSGSGLGLAISQQIVKAHSGTIAVSSQLGAGTTFTVTLPKNRDKGHV